jgi:hypothetical protein
MVKILGTRQDVQEIKEILIEKGLITEAEIVEKRKQRGKK